MPLGNLTSQFFANVYLTELDYFIKHDLKIKYYIRYVDDFVILHYDKRTLDEYKLQINDFLKEVLKLELHPDKSSIINLTRGINFLGFRVFYSHKLLKKSNIRNFYKKLEEFKKSFANGGADYDKIYESFQGWNAYAMHANTCALRRKAARKIEECFHDQISSVEIDRWLKTEKNTKLLETFIN